MMPPHQPHLTEGKDGQLVEGPAIPGVHLEGHLVPPAKVTHISKYCKNTFMHRLRKINHVSSHEVLKWGKSLCKEKKN